MTAENLWFWLGGGLVTGFFVFSIVEVYTLAPVAIWWTLNAAIFGVAIGARIGIAMCLELLDRAKKRGAL